MNILFLSSSDSNGGAAKATYRLFSTLKKKNIQCKLLVKNKTLTDNDIIEPSGLLERFFFKILVRIDQLPLLPYYKTFKRVPWTNGWFAYNLHRKINKFIPDIIQLNWVGGGFFPIKTLLRFNKPIIWRLSDSNPFTGGCHLPENCDRYKQGCGYCPILNSNKQFDRSRKNIEAKLKYWGNKIVVIAPSNWMASCARESLVFRSSRIEVIPTGINISQFKPLNKIQAKTTLNLPIHKKIILFGSVNAEIDKNKGLTYFLNSLKILIDKIDNFNVVIFGSENARVEQYSKYTITYFKSLNSSELSVLYSAADVFVNTSLIENLPNTIIESMACGTPVVAFNTGGISDIIDSEINGYLSDLEDSASIAENIYKLLVNSNYNQMIVNGINKIKNNFDINVITQKYIDLYNSVLLK